LADQFPLVNDTQKAREELSVLLPKEDQHYLEKNEVKIIACLPGSRRVEVEHIGSTLWQAVADLSVSHGSIHCVIPALNKERREQIEAQLSQYPKVSASIVDGHSQTVMAAADCVVMASGTTTLEAMLLKKPMVVVYKKDALSYWIISRMLTVDHVSLPNLLAGEEVVPELIQDAATPEAVSKAIAHWLENPALVVKLQERFTALHNQLKVNASETAADVIENLLSSR
jgi:lipid-A-disaccharide synthase